MCLTRNQINTLSNKYNIPQSELFSLLINLEGVNHHSENNRIRFELCNTGINTLMFSVQNNNSSILNINNHQLVFDNTIIGNLKGVCEDSCEVFYTRNNGKVLCFNPYSRSSCNGCKFCYNPTSSDDKRIISDKEIYNELLKWAKKNKHNDLSHIEQIAVVTGCFGNDKLIADYLLKLRSSASKLSFNGEILFFGTPHDGKTIHLLNSIKPFNLCFTIECFENRNNLIRNDKLVELEKIKDLMLLSKSMGIHTNFSYIVGLDSLSVIKKQFQTMISFINRFPIISIYQTDSKRKKVRNKEAFEIEYYLEVRKIIEKIFWNTELRPTKWSNHRSIWREYFGNNKL